MNTSVNAKVRMRSMVGASLFLLAACSSTPEQPEPVVEPAPPVVPVRAEAQPPRPTPKAMAGKATHDSKILFEYNRTLITPAGREVLDDVAKDARTLNLEIVIGVGHADRIGSDKFNEKLAMRRAEAVKAYLVSKGVAAGRIRTETRGERQPVKNCSNTERQALIECLAPNRRVDIQVVGSPRS